MSSEINDTIEERLYELKEMVAPVSYKELLRTFDWSYVWFLKAEKILLNLAYRGESDKEIVEFIRNQVLNTNILEFNESFMRNHGLKPIKNHYEMIMMQRNRKIRNAILVNPNKSILDYAIDYYFELTQVDSTTLSECVSDKAIEFLMENPDKIYWFALSNNTNIKAAKYCIANEVINARTLSKIRDPEFLRYLMMSQNIRLDIMELSRNPSDIVADFFAQNTDVIDVLDLEHNTNPRVVEFLLANVDRVDFEVFSSNPDDRVVDYLVANPDKINWVNFSGNTNDRAVAYLLENPDKINWINFSGNNCDRAVRYLINNPDKIVSTEFCRNSNDHAVEFMLSFDDFDPTYLSDNPCNYNKQKIEAFNNAKVFAKVPHFSI